MKFKKQLLKNPLIIIGGSILLLWILLGLCSFFITPFDPLEVNMAKRLLPPGREHLMGTDNFGRDIFSRIIEGSKISLGLGTLSVIISFSLGALSGSLSGYYGGRIGTFMMRIMDVLQAFPTFVLIISISVALKRSPVSAMLAIGITNTPSFARLMYAQTSRLRNGLLVESQHALGTPDAFILFRHVIPNCMSVVIVQAAFSLGSAILSLASLSFIGIGISPPTPEWGAMISDARGYIISGEWWLFTFPGIAIASLILAFHLLGDGLRDILDPRSE